MGEEEEEEQGDKGEEEGGDKEEEEDGEKDREAAGRGDEEEEGVYTERDTRGRWPRGTPLSLMHSVPAVNPAARSDLRQYTSTSTSGWRSTPSVFIAEEECG